MFNFNAIIFIFTVWSAHTPNADSQSYHLFALENILARPLQYNLTGTEGNNTSTTTSTNTTATATINPFLDPNNVNNTKIILYKNTVVEHNGELSQTAMDVITIVWYVATFLALAAFFMLMACSDRRCRDVRGQQSNNGTTEGQRAPPTPSPSYSEFAPPSYDTVIKMQRAAKTSVFVIPFPPTTADNNNDNKPPVSPSSPCQVYSINEVQKTTQ